MNSTDSCLPRQKLKMSYHTNSLWRLTLRRLLRQRSAQIGMVILVF